MRLKFLIVVLFLWLFIPSALASEPTVASSNLKVGTITCNSAQLTWTSGNGTWHLILLKEASAVNSTPTDNSNYLSNANFGVGSELGSGNFVVFNNITNNGSITNLKTNTKYYATVFEHDGIGPDYLTSKSVSVNFTTGSLSLGFTFETTADSCEKTNTATFKNTSVANFGWIKYTWTYGDGLQDTGVNAIHTFAKGGSFSVSIQASPSLGCKDMYTSSKPIFIVPRPVSKAFEKNNDTVQCFDGHLFKFDDNTQLAKIPKCAYVRTWFFSSTDSATIPNPSKTYSKPGKYRIFYRSETLYDNNNTGCTDTTSLFVRVVASPSTGVSINDSVQCLKGNKFNFFNDFTGLVSYRWDLGNGITSVLKSASRSFTAVGNYPIIHEATSSDGCSGIDTVYVHVKANVDPTFSGLPSSVCEGSAAITLTPNETGGKFYGSVFSGNSFSPFKSGVFKITYVVDDLYCPDSSSQTITVSPKPKLNLGKDTTLCDGASVDLVILIPGTVLWNDGSKLNVRSISAAGKYSANINNNGCIAEDTILIKTNVSPSVSLPDDTTLCQGSLIKLIAPLFPNTTIQWSNGSNDTAIYVSTAGTYSVSLTNACGTATDLIVVSLMSGDCDLFIPTAFTPNGDGRNEIFQFFSKGAKPLLFQIYNRWGEMIFDSRIRNSYEWDGYYQGNICQAGMYSYVFRYELKTGDLIRRKTVFGNIHLIR